jgi:hypothetical protein
MEMGQSLAQQMKPLQQSLRLGHQLTKKGQLLVMSLTLQLK